MAILSSSFTRNSAGVQAGAILVDDGAAALLLDASALTNNTAQRGPGGGVALTQAGENAAMRVQLHLTACNLTGNTALTERGYGGAVSLGSDANLLELDVVASRFKGGQKEEGRWWCVCVLWGGGQAGCGFATRLRVLVTGRSVWLRA